MIGSIFQFEDLQELCRPGEKPRRATVEAWAKKIGLAYAYDGQGGIWTTLDALNQAVGVRAQPGNDLLRPEDIF